MNRVAPFARQGMLRFWRITAVVLAISLTTGCATSPGQDSQADSAISDPLEGMNRHIFAFNDAVDTTLIRPAAFIYREATPWPIKDIVSNFLGNLTLPLTIIHDLLQGKPDQAQIAATRLFINTTVGIAGLFDVATPSGYPIHREDMGQTMAVAGVGHGPYLVLPILGPSSFRDGFGTVIDAFADPVTIASYGVTNGFTLRVSRAAAAGLVEREKLIEPMDTLRQSLDFYATVRAAYGQRRALDVRDGRPSPAANGADPFATFDDSEQKPAPKPGN